MLKSKKVNYCYFFSVIIIAYAIIIGSIFHARIKINHDELAGYFNYSIAFYVFAMYGAAFIKMLIVRKNQTDNELSPGFYAFSLSPKLLSEKDKSILLKKYPFVKCLYQIHRLLTYLIIAHLLHIAFIVFM